jgi:5-oxoprolinase (ATP-hydrolysing) subunit A
MIDINCDVGEGLNNEHLLMPYISSCNIACGGHAGDIETMTQVVSLALKNNVKIGSHPSYPDKENFGRKSIEISKEALKKTITFQIQSLEEIAEKTGAQLYHLKPHGALYNDLAKNETLADGFLDIIEVYKTKYKLYIPYNSAIAKVAKRRNFDIIYEAFADRNYNDDGSLVSRQKSNSIITDIGDIIAHISQIKNKGKVTTISGKKVITKADTFCVHSDTKNAVELVRNIHKFFNS